MPPPRLSPLKHVLKTGKYTLEYTQGILTNYRYMEREFKLKLGTLIKAYDVKFTENSKK